MKPTALVTGAGGVIGSELVRHLSRLGYQVRAFVRDAPPAGKFPDGVQVVRGEITDRRAVQEAIAGADQVFHLAAKLHVNNPPAELKGEYYRVNVEGTRCLVRAAQAANVGRVVFFSSISVYGATKPGQVLCEDAPLNPDSWYAETKAQAEQDVLAGGGQPVVLRLAAVYGPGMKGNYPRLLSALRKRRLVIIGDGRNRRTLVYLDDACAAALAAAEHPEAAGQIYNITDGHVHALQEIIGAMSDAVGQLPPRFYLPTRAARFAAGLLEDGLRMLGKPSPVGRATIDKFVEDVAVKGTRIQSQLGFRPRYSLSEGWRRTVELSYGRGAESRNGS